MFRVGYTHARIFSARFIATLSSWLATLVLPQVCGLPRLCILGTLPFMQTPQATDLWMEGWSASTVGEIQSGQSHVFSIPTPGLFLDQMLPAEQMEVRQLLPLVRQSKSPHRSPEHSSLSL